MRPSKNPHTALGVVLKELRKERGATKREIAKKADLKYAHYIAIEGGTVKPLWGTMKRLAKALGVTLEEISKRDRAQSAD